MSQRRPSLNLDRQGRGDPAATNAADRSLAMWPTMAEDAMSAFAATTLAALLLANPSMSDASRVAADGGFLLGNAHRCGVAGDRIVEAGQLIRDLIAAAAEDGRSRRKPPPGSPASSSSAPLSMRRRRRRRRRSPAARWRGNSSGSNGTTASRRPREDRGSRPRPPLPSRRRRVGLPPRRLFRRPAADCVGLPAGAAELSGSRPSWFGCRPSRVSPPGRRQNAGGSDAV